MFFNDLFSIYDFGSVYIDNVVSNIPADGPTTQPVNEENAWEMWGYVILDPPKEISALSETDWNIPMSDLLYISVSFFNDATQLP